MALSNGAEQWAEQARLVPVAGGFMTTSYRDPAALHGRAAPPHRSLHVALSRASYATVAKSLSWGNPEDDGVGTNVERIRFLLEDEGVAPIKTGKSEGGPTGAPPGAADALI